MNLYAYCANNPVNWIDPWGLSKEWPWFEGWGTLVDISILGTAAHIGYDIGVGIRKTGELIVDSPKKAEKLGQKRKRGIDEIAEGKREPDGDPIGGDNGFNDWGKEVIDRATSVPGTSLTGPPTPPTSIADAVVEVLKEAEKKMNEENEPTLSDDTE